MAKCGTQFSPTCVVLYVSYDIPLQLELLQDSITMMKCDSASRLRLTMPSVEGGCRIGCESNRRTAPRSHQEMALELDHPAEANTRHTSSQTVYGRVQGHAGLPFRHTVTPLLASSVTFDCDGNSVKISSHSAVVSWSSVIKDIGHDTVFAPG